MRAYTDVRFPGCTIVNDGSSTFRVYERGVPLTSFESWEKPDGRISEAFAGRRAKDYFERWSNLVTAVDLDTAVLSEAVLPVELAAGDATRNIDALMAQERMTEDSQQKREICQRIAQLMRREESTAEATVNHLLCT